MMKNNILPQFISTPFMPYVQAVCEMEQYVEAMIHQGRHDKVWFLEHEPIYTKGASAKDADLLDPLFPVHETNRGGQFTYHGPGQLMIYCMLDLRHYNKDLKAYTRALEEWMIIALKKLSVHAFIKDGRVGVWVVQNGYEKKIAAIGVRVKKWITWHGLCLNIDPDLSHYKGIIPCGIQDAGVTSLSAFNIQASRSNVENILETTFQQIPFFNARASAP